MRLLLLALLLALLLLWFRLAEVLWRLLHMLVLMTHPCPVLLRGLVVRHLILRGGMRRITTEGVGFAKCEQRSRDRGLQAARAR